MDWGAAWFTPTHLGQSTSYCWQRCCRKWERVLLLTIKAGRRRMNPSWIRRITTITTMLAITVIWLTPLAMARGGISHRDVASTRHIEELPLEMRSALARWQSACGVPLAPRDSFAHYLGDKAIGYRLISLHFHELSCINKTTLCTAQGCLHQVYVSTDGVYRLAFSANVPDVTLTFLDGRVPAIEIDCDTFSTQCRPRVLRWNGRGFAER